MEGERKREEERKGKGNKMKKIFDPVASSMSLHDDHEIPVFDRFPRALRNAQSMLTSGL